MTQPPIPRPKRKPGFYRIEQGYLPDRIVSNDPLYTHPLVLKMMGVQGIARKFPQLPSNSKIPRVRKRY